MEKYKATKQNNNQEQANEEEVPVQKSKEERDAENNANTLKNAADVAIATKNPYAMAAGYAVKGLDKITGGKSTQALGKAWAKANKVSPGGKQIQNLSNQLSESGAGDKIGSVASQVSAAKGGGGGGSTSVGGAAAKSATAQNAGKQAAAKNANSKAPNGTSTDSSSGGNDSVFSSNSSPFTKNVVSFPGMNMKKVVIIGLVILLFLNALVVTFAGKDMANLSLTNDTTVTSTSESVDVDSTSLDGGNGNLMTDGQSLLALLGQEKIDSWNTKIQNSVAAAGVRTGSAPATAAYTLVKGALDEGIVLPYFWGGGHGTISTGVNSNWGAKEKVAVSGSSKQPAGSYFPAGLDCSGFVSWALKNGGCSDFTPIVSGNFTSLGPKISPTSAKAGDIPANSTHVMIVLENTGSSLLVAEAKAPGTGIVFSEYEYGYFAKYTVVDMSDYYNINCKG